MKKTIIFLSGFAVLPAISKSAMVFDEPFWKDYKTIFYQSRTPTSTLVIENELHNLNWMIEQQSKTSEVYLVGHSLGAWWAANLACRPQFNVKKMALWTPLGIAGVFPIFRVGKDYEPFNRTPSTNMIGPDKNLVVYAKQDLIVPYKAHALPLVEKFQAASYSLNGGHMWQSNHRDGLILMKDWFSL